MNKIMCQKTVKRQIFGSLFSSPRDGTHSRQLLCFTLCFPHKGQLLQFHNWKFSYILLTSKVTAFWVLTHSCHSLEATVIAFYQMTAVFQCIPLVLTPVRSSSYPDKKACKKSSSWWPFGVHWGLGVCNQSPIKVLFLEKTETEEKYFILVSCKLFYLRFQNF